MNAISPVSSPSTFCIGTWAVLVLRLPRFSARIFRIGPWKVLLGAAMGACSFSGQAFTGLALSHGIPGHIAFPLTTGGSLFLVAGAGILLFKEKVGKYGIAGMVIGILALVLLSVG